MAGKSKKSGLGKGLETLIPVGEMEEIDNLIVKEKKTVEILYLKFLR